MKKIMFFATILSVVLQGCSKSDDIEDLVTTSKQQKVTLKNKALSNSDFSEELKNENLYSYSKGIHNLSNNSSIMYVANTALTNDITKKLPVVVVMHGWLGSKEKMAWIGKLLAQNGFASIVITGGNYKNFFTNPRDWEKNYEDAVKSILIETQRKDSPLYDRLDTDKISIVGHSMGGGGAFFFADNSGFKVKSIVALAPYCLEIKKPGAKTICPTIIIAGGKDILATTYMTKNIFNTVNSKLKKYSFYKKVGHNDFEKGGKFHNEIGNDIVMWISKYGK